MIRPIWAILTQTFIGSPKLKKMAGAAFLCLVLSLVFAAITSWLSQPVYEGIARSSMYAQDASKAGWVAAIVIALAMFLFCSTIGYFFAEKMKKLDSLLEPSFVGVIAFLALAIGAFDSYKGFSTGSEARAKEAYATTQFVDELASREKPYAQEIADLDAKIEALQNDKVMWQGKYVTRERSSRQAVKLMKQREKWVEMQMEELGNMKAYHTEETTTLLHSQETAKGTLQGIAIVLYLLQIVLAVPLANFDIACDMESGERDGVYAEDEKEHNVKNTNIEIASNPYAKIPSIGFSQAVGKGRDKRHELELRREIEQLRNQAAQVGQRVDNTPVNPPLTQSFVQPSGKSSEEALPIPKGITVNEDDIRFLNKWRHAVKLIIREKTSGEIIQYYKDNDIRHQGQRLSNSRSTIKNIKRVMRALKMIPEYSK